jgi:prepilin signal peptidase PulO-like enzyme (type II secretory pathway)
MIVLYALLGLSIGILINLAADQLPRRRRLSRRPFCPDCDQPRPWWAWSGAVAYLRFKPQCDSCHAPISWRHPLVELGTVALFAFLWQRYAAGEQTILLLYSLYSAIMILLLVIDLEHRLIPNVVVYPASVLAFLGSLLHPSPHFYCLALLGGALGFGLLWLIYLLGKVFVRVLGRARGKPIEEVAFGLGDVRLGGLLGLMLGIPQVLQALLLGMLLGGLCALFYLLIQALILRRYSVFTPIPYGPFLILGASAVLFFGPF